MQKIPEIHSSLNYTISDSSSLSRKTSEILFLGNISRFLSNQNAHSRKNALYILLRISVLI